MFKLRAFLKDNIAAVGVDLKSENQPEIRHFGYYPISDLENLSEECEKS
jgi:hypothetical protein